MFNILIGLATGILSGFGIGGGSLLMLWLTIVQQMPQTLASGTNLLYFLCCAPFALILHIKNGLVDKKATLFCIIGAIPCVVFSSLMTATIDVELLHKAFGVLLLVVGGKELFHGK